MLPPTNNQEGLSPGWQTLRGLLVATTPKKERSSVQSFKSNMTLSEMKEESSYTVSSGVMEGNFLNDSVHVYQEAD